MFDPAHPNGFLGYIALGAGAAVVLLLVATYFPSVIPTRAANTKL